MFPIGENVRQGQEGEGRSLVRPTEGPKKASGGGGGGLWELVSTGEEGSEGRCIE